MQNLARKFEKFRKRQCERSTERQQIRMNRKYRGQFWDRACQCYHYDTFESMIGLIKLNAGLAIFPRRTKTREFGEFDGGLIEIASSHLKVFPGSLVSTFSLRCRETASLRSFSDKKEELRTAAGKEFLYYDFTKHPLRVPSFPRSSHSSAF